MSAPQVPGAARSITTIAAVTWRRLLRGRAVWVSVAIAMLPVLYAAASKRIAHRGAGDELFVFEVLICAVLAPMFVASSIGEEIEDRTTTYLWSRPITRWSIIAGKLLAFVPVTAAISATSWTLAHQLAWDTWPTARPLGALIACASVLCVVAAGIATLAPRHGMALTICYFLFFDSPVGVLPATLKESSITHQVRSIAGVWFNENAIARPLIALGVIVLVWLLILGARLRRLEA